MTNQPPPQYWPQQTPTPKKSSMSGPIFALYIIAAILGLITFATFQAASNSIGSAIGVLAFGPSMLVATTVALTGALVAHAQHLSHQP